MAKDAKQYAQHMPQINTDFLVPVSRRPQLADTSVGADPINPNYYKFPSGAEVIQITENLTGNGAQVVQYVARSTRLDGRNKGDQLENMRKARWFLDREIARLEDLEVAAV